MSHISKFARLGAGAAAAALLVACGGGGGAGGSTGASGTAERSVTSVSSHTPLPGAIFTTTSACDDTDVNLYDAKTDVYVNGGPASPNAAGLLPDTDYFIKVTTPSGDLLGTSGNVAPITTDINGKFVSCPRLADVVHYSDTDLTPGYRDTTNEGGVYKVWVSTGADFANDSTKTDNFRIRPATPPATESTASVTIRKFYDANADGQWTVGEPLLGEDSGAGWKVSLTGFETGDYFTPHVFSNLILDTLVAKESTPVETNWYPTNAYVDTFKADAFVVSPAGSALNQISVPLASDKKTATVYFGNVCLGAGGGHTLGYWSNKNGEAALNAASGGMDAALSLLTGLSLRNSDGSDFNPNGYAELKSWLLNGDATNMANMLSVQLATMELNVYTGIVSGSSLVHAPGATGANAGGFMTINALMTEADQSLADHAMTRAGYESRTYQEWLKNALDKANNNLNFVQSAPCSYSFVSTP